MASEFSANIFFSNVDVEDRDQVFDSFAVHKILRFFQEIDNSQKSSHFRYTHRKVVNRVEHHTNDEFQGKFVGKVYIHNFSLIVHPEFFQVKPLNELLVFSDKVGALVHHSIDN